MPMLQKRPKFGMKMAESWLSMDQFPLNHHIMPFLIHENYAVKSKWKKKNMKKLGLKFMMSTLQKRPKLVVTARSFLNMIYKII